MGNCQAADTAIVVIQQPNGKEEKLSYQVSANFVKKMKPGNCVSLAMEDLLDSRGLSSSAPRKCLPSATSTDSSLPKVMKGLMAKKCSKLKKEGNISEDKLEMVKAISYKLDYEDQMKKQEKERSRISRSWQPSLQSISEGGSS